MINKHLVGLELNHPVIKINKPFYLGMVILELAKYYMYDFHYNVMKKHYGTDITLLYTDTDSLVYEIKTDDVYSDFAVIAPNMMDFSNYPTDHFLFSPDKKRVPGCFKDECAGRVIRSFVGLRAKMYSFCIEGGGGQKCC